LTLPPAVILNLFFDALCVLSFGITITSFLFRAGRANVLPRIAAEIIF
jgi:hypothetical protein